MSQYTFHYTGTSQVANGGTVTWSTAPETGASTGNVAMPAAAGVVSFAITSVEGTEEPEPPIPTTAQIVGIEMVIGPYASVSNTIVDYTAQITKSGTPCQNKATGAYLGTSDPNPGSPIIYGSPTDLWGTTWSVADVLTIDWLYQVQNSAGIACHVWVDGLTITVYTNEAGGGGSAPIPHQLAPRMTVYPPDGKRFL